MEETTTNGKGINPVFIITAVVIVLLIGIGVVMVQRSNSDNLMENEESMEQIAQPSPESTSTTTPAAEDSMTEGDTKTITIEAGSFYYKPNEIKVKKGDKVKIVMNSVSMMHDFVIDDLDVRLPVTPSGKTGTVEFTADKVGSFEFYCSVGNHRQQGQVGTLIVEE